MTNLVLGLFLVAAALALSLFWLLQYGLSDPAGGTRLLPRAGRALAVFMALVLAAQVPLALYFLHGVLDLRAKNPRSTSLMRLRGWSEGIAPSFLPLDAMPPDFVAGIVACEDSGFYNHVGFSPSNIRAAIRVNLKLGYAAYGGSTITQQLARTLFLSPRKSLVRKYLELMISLEMELVLEKDRILELYANYAEWGPGIYGAEDAARYHYGRDLWDLELGDFAGLLTILPNPRRWDPATYRESPVLVRRHELILGFYGLTREDGTMAETQVN